MLRTNSFSCGFHGGKKVLQFWSNVSRIFSETSPSPTIPSICFVGVPPCVWPGRQAVEEPAALLRVLRLEGSVVAARRGLGRVQRWVRAAALHGRVHDEHRHHGIHQHYFRASHEPCVRGGDACGAHVKWSEPAINSRLSKFRETLGKIFGPTLGSTLGSKSGSKSGLSFSLAHVFRTMLPFEF